ncbi:hypothetical protein ILUMI_08791 [Ignelater luminosus]|uniref:Uncharacterized protein n=1 Tax=Ignelater luminosus TaxID=2038154 RepID=A0A8K0GGP5_IGNLU|nr:hypothetical protein ILUMI_08791 [Ignelater luminosus]
MDKQTVWTSENVAAVQQAMLRSPRRSVSQHALRLGISDTSTDPPRTIPAPKQRIAAIPVNTLREIMQNFQARLQEYLNFNGDIWQT